MTTRLEVPQGIARKLAELASSFGSSEDAERSALNMELPTVLEQVEGWRAFGEQLSAALRLHQYAVLQGLANDAVTLILAATAAGSVFRRYRASKVVKRFTLSPWTTALSHTTAEGHFHTDLNTSPCPPRVTCIQCVQPDPDAPRKGENRVASLDRLLENLAATNNWETLRFMRDHECTMVSDSDPGAWKGTIVSGAEIRFHPETLRAAQRRFQLDLPLLERHLGVIKDAAIAVSERIQLERGDILFVSNRRALHYRGACTVRFREYPRNFESRIVHVLHLMDETA